DRHQHPHDRPDPAHDLHGRPPGRQQAGLDLRGPAPRGKTRGDSLVAPQDAAAARFATKLRGFGLVGILAILAIALTGNIVLGPKIVIPIGAVLALVWVRWSRTPWREIGYARPKSWALTVVIGIVFGVALKFLMKAVVMPLFGADPINRAFHFLAGNRAML